MPETDFKRSRNQQQQQQQQPQQQYQNKRRNQQSHTDRPRSEGPKREAILDLNKYKGEQIRVRCVGGRQITGILKGFDQLMNLVLEDVTEQLRGMLNPFATPSPLISSRKKEFFFLLTNRFWYFSRLGR
ncbi:uncharacterized protein LODBEIA_P56100 [Lodderomyces beijingensis]|uniref:Sm domain-containing protein n=1 Tax=Lodderomyces beijingensis TaxID=1775926 RepID=A0ABP0ZVT2_9ASCO